MGKKLSNTQLQELAIEKKIKRRNFISFVTFFIGAGAAFGGWKWLYNSPQETAGITAGARQPLRRALNKTELFFRRFFNNDHMVKTYPKERAAKIVRVNSDIGMNQQNFNADNWQLLVISSSGNTLKIGIE